MNRELKRLSVVIAVMFLALFVVTTYIQVVAVDSLSADGRNTRVLFDSYKTQRGSIRVDGSPVAISLPSGDEYSFQRTYPDPFVYAQTTGFYSLNHGVMGIEGALNSFLSGTDNAQFLDQLNALLTGKPISGATVDLTLSARVQQAAWDALGTFTGAVTVLEVDTGKIVAMASTPSYDPNSLSSHDENSVIQSYERLVADPSNPLTNRVIDGRMNPPGSTFKLVVAAAALESGKYTPESTFPNPSELLLPQTTVLIHNSDGKTCGPGDVVTMRDALRLSCNIPFAELGMELGSKALLTQAEKFGFNTSFTIPMSVEASSFPLVLDTPQTGLASFGQFDVRATPLQIAMLSAAIANGGVLMTPNVVESITSSDLKPISTFTPREFSRPISPSTAATLRDMMIGDVANGAASNAKISGVDVGGKTGTAENGEDQPYSLWFTGFAGNDAHTYAVTVLIEDGGGMGQNGYGNLLAAPIAKKVLEAVLNK